jgi:hypothetical protein
MNKELQSKVFEGFKKFVSKHYSIYDRVESYYRTDPSVLKRTSQVRSLLTKPLSHYESQESIDGARHSMNLFLKYGATLRTGEIKSAYYKMLTIMIQNLEA